MHGEHQRDQQGPKGLTRGQKGPQKGPHLGSDPQIGVWTPKWPCGVLKWTTLRGPCLGGYPLEALYDTLYLRHPRLYVNQPCLGLCKYIMHMGPKGDQRAYEGQKGGPKGVPDPDPGPKSPPDPGSDPQNGIMAKMGVIRSDPQNALRPQIRGLDPDWPS